VKTYIDCTFVGTDLPESTPPDEAGEFEDCMHEFLVAVSEIPKPFDPENFPEGMIVTDAELVFLLRKHFSPLIERMAPRWISVEERLPNYSSVLAITADRQIDIYQWNLVADYANDPDPSARITHWQPLPNPPQKGST
jgi:hypothetical protein